MAIIVDCDLFLPASIIVIQQILRASFPAFRWPTCATTRRLQ